MNNFHIFAKLVAISIVGGVAKSLFGPEPKGPTVINQTLDTVKDVVVKKDGDES